MNFKLKIISHASVFIDLGEVKLLTDPWLFGNCFNDGWSLKKANLSEENITQDEIKALPICIYLMNIQTISYSLLKSLVSNLISQMLKFFAKMIPE